MAAKGSLQSPDRPEGLEAALTASRHRQQAKWESVSVSAAMLIVVAAGILGLWVSSRNSAYENLSHYLTGLAEAAATVVDPELQNKIRKPEQLNDADYLRAVEPLRRLRHAVPDIHYVYTLVLDGGAVHFVLDAADPNAKRAGGGSDQSGVWEVYEQRTPAMMLAFGDGRGSGVVSATTEPVTDDWGTFMTGFAPLRDAGGHQIGVVGVDVDASVFLGRQKASRERALLGLAPAGFLIALLGSVFYRIRLRSLADFAARKAMEAVLLEAAQQDKLTGLPNREVFLDRLGHTLQRVRTGEQLQFAVLFLDFDRFKLVNDTLGHEAGDELLRQIARRLHSCLRGDAAGIANSEDVLISRFGGDEFLVLIDDSQGARNVVRVSEHLLEALAPAYDVLSREVHSMASVGIVIGDPVSCNSSAEEIVRNADVAMYEAKRSGRGCCVVFNEGMHARLTRHVAIEASLRRALGSDELYLEYQPIVDLHSGRRLYVEALLRWHHPTMGLISPSEFIPIAEESGLIVAVGQWVLENACRAMIEWQKRDPRNAPAMVSVNISRAELALGSRLLEQVQGALEAVGLPPNCLQL